MALSYLTAEAPDFLALELSLEHQISQKLWKCQWYPTVFFSSLLFVDINDVLAIRGTLNFSLFIEHRDFQYLRGRSSVTRVQVYTEFAQRKDSLPSVFVKNSSPLLLFFLSWFTVWRRNEEAWGSRGSRQGWLRWTALFRVLPRCGRPQVLTKAWADFYFHFWERYCW